MEGVVLIMPFINKMEAVVNEEQVKEIVKETVQDITAMKYEVTEF